MRLYAEIAGTCPSRMARRRQIDQTYAGYKNLQRNRKSQDNKS